MRRADVSVHVDQRRPPCVLEPSLLLGHAHGPTLAMRLVAVFEPWLTRSFWQALDNSELLMGRSAMSVARPSALNEVERAWEATSPTISSSALTRWITLRERTDESAWVLRWVGDRIAESQLRDVDDLSLFDQFELLQAELEQRAERCHPTKAAAWHGFDLRRAALDALSLSAVLEGALVLCSAEDGREPAAVTLARQLGLTVVDPHTPEAQASLFPTEREFLREALARAGLAPLAQSLPPLAALHVCLDTAPARPAGSLLDDDGVDGETFDRDGDRWDSGRVGSTGPAGPDAAGNTAGLGSSIRSMTSIGPIPLSGTAGTDDDDDEAMLRSLPDPGPEDPWQQARVWWYRL